MGYLVAAAILLAGLIVVGCGVKVYQDEVEGFLNKYIL